MRRQSRGPGPDFGPMQLSDADSEGEGDVLHSEEEGFMDDDAEGDPQNPNGVKHVFRNST
jgi:hypothetical protein